MWFIVDIETRFPNRFELPSRLVREALDVDSFAKLVFTTPTLFAKGRGERMWVRVLERKADNAYHGMLVNKPTLLQNDLKEGTTLDFRPEHITDAMAADVVTSPLVKEGEPLNDAVDLKSTGGGGGGGGGVVLLVLAAFAFGGRKGRKR